MVSVPFWGWLEAAAILFFGSKSAFDSWSDPGKVAPEMSSHVSGSEEIHFKARMHKYVYI